MKNCKEITKFGLYFRAWLCLWVILIGTIIGICTLGFYLPDFVGNLIRKIWGD
jgi:hypothetical protein